MDLLWMASLAPAENQKSIAFPAKTKHLYNIYTMLQCASLRLVTGAKKGTSCELLLRTLNKLLKLCSIINHKGPSCLENSLLNLNGGASRVTRSKTFQLFRPFYCTSEQFRFSILPSSVSFWNTLPASTRSCTVFANFRANLGYSNFSVKTKVPMQFYIGNRDGITSMTSFRLSTDILAVECVYIESVCYTSGSNLSALLVKVLWKD